MRLQCHVFFLLLALSAAAIVYSRKEASGPYGGWRPIKDLSDPHVQEIAEFAVTEHNRRPPTIFLKLESIIRGETQVVAGKNYRLVLSASSGGSSAACDYQAIVLEKPWLLNSLNLTSFVPVKA